MKHEFNSEKKQNLEKSCKINPLANSMQCKENFNLCNKHYSVMHSLL